MKKALLMALAALTVSVAQAVTWSEYYGTSGSVDTTSTAGTIYGGCSGTIAAFITYGAEVSNGTLLTLRRGSATDTAGQIVLSIANGVYVLSTYNSSSGVTTNTTTVTPSASGTDSIVISMQRGSSADNGAGTINSLSLYINGSETLSLSNVTVTGGPYAYLAWGSEVEATYDIYETIATDSSAYYSTADAMTAAVTTIPEPTVLALLALGVAGLALKRKVA